MPKRMYTLGVVALLMGIDVCSKLLALSRLTPEVPTAIFSWLNMTLSFNQGMAFSMLSEGFWWQRIFLCTVSWLGALLFLFWLMKETEAAPSERWVLVFLTAGAAGNGIDRVVYGYVIDFIDMHWKNWHFATFNVADVCINLGVILLLVNYFLNNKPLAQRTPIRYERT